MGKAVSSASTDMTEIPFFIVEVLDLSRIVFGICTELITLKRRWKSGITRVRLSGNH
jgi:hypothetical protein